MVPMKRREEFGERSRKACMRQYAPIRTARERPGLIPARFIGPGEPCIDSIDAFPNETGRRRAGKTRFVIGGREARGDPARLGALSLSNGLDFASAWRDAAPRSDTFQRHAVGVW